MGMGITLKLGNGNGKEWELTAQEWEGMGIKKIKTFPVISNVRQQHHAAQLVNFINYKKIIKV